MQLSLRYAVTKKKKCDHSRKKLMGSEKRRVGSLVQRPASLHAIELKKRAENGHEKRTARRIGECRDLRTQCRRSWLRSFEHFDIESPCGTFTQEEGNGRLHVQASTSNKGLQSDQRKVKKTPQKGIDE